MEFNEKIKQIVLDIDDPSKKNKIIEELAFSHNDELHKIARAAFVGKKKEALYIIKTILSSNMKEVLSNYLITDCTIKIFNYIILNLCKNMEEDINKYNELFYNVYNTIIECKNNFLIALGQKLVLGIFSKKECSNNNDEEKKYLKIFVDLNTKLLKYKWNCSNEIEKIDLIKVLFEVFSENYRFEVKAIINNFIFSETNPSISEDFAKKLFCVHFSNAFKNPSDQKLIQEYEYQIIECFKTKTELIIPCFMEVGRIFIEYDKSVLIHIYEELRQSNLIDNNESSIIEGIINARNLFALFLTLSSAERNANTIETLAQVDINHSIDAGVNIDAYAGLSSKFTNFIRCTIIGDDEDDKFFDKINKQLVELEKLDKGNTIEILKKYAFLINNILFLSKESRNGIVEAFKKQPTLEEKINETFPQVGTIILNSAKLNKINKPVIGRSCTSNLIEIANNIKKLNEIEPNSDEQEIRNLKQNLKDKFQEANRFVKEIVLELFRGSSEFFDKLEEELKSNLVRCSNSFDSLDISLV